MIFGVFMKLAVLGTLIAASLALPACSSSLEQIVESRQQQRVDAANARSATFIGARDGLGFSAGDPASTRVTLVQTSQ